MAPPPPVDETPFFLIGIYVDFNIRDVNIEFSGMNFASHHDYIINHCNSGVSVLGLGEIQRAVTRNAMTI